MSCSCDLFKFDRKNFFPQNRQDTANMTILENIFAIIATHDNIERKSELLLKQ